MSQIFCNIVFNEKFTTMNILLDKYKSYLLTEKFDLVIFSIAQDLYYYGKEYGSDNDKYLQTMESIRNVAQLYEKYYRTTPDPDAVNFWDVNFNIKNTLRTVFAIIEWDESINNFLAKMSDTQYYLELTKKHGKWDKNAFIALSNTVVHPSGQSNLHTTKVVEDPKVNKKADEPKAYTVNVTEDKREQDTWDLAQEKVKTEDKRDLETTLWEKVKRQDTLEAVTEFLKKFPNGKFYKEADKLIDKYIAESQPKSKPVEVENAADTTQRKRDDSRNESDLNQRESNFLQYKQIGDNDYKNNRMVTALEAYEKALANKWDDEIYKRVKLLKTKKKKTSGGVKVFFTLIVLGVIGYYGYNYYIDNQKDSVVTTEVWDWWTALSPEWKTILSSSSYVSEYPTRDELYSLLTQEYVYITNDTISNIEPLQMLVNCKNLYLDAPYVTNITIIQYLINLETIDISKTNVTDILPLKGNPKLVTVYVRTGQIPEDIKLQFSDGNFQSYLYEQEVEFINPLDTTNVETSLEEEFINTDDTTRVDTVGIEELINQLNQPD